MAEAGDTPRPVSKTESRPPEPRVQSVAEARAEVAKDIQKAELAESKTPVLGEDTKKSLAQKIKDAFKSKKTEASELREHVKEQKASGLTENNRKKAQETKLAMAKTLEAVKQGIIEVPSQRNRTLITKLDERLGLSLSDESAAPLYPLIDRLITSDITIRDLQTEFDQIKQHLNQDTLREVSQAIIDTAQEGTLGINAKRAATLFKPELPEPPKEKEEEKKEEPKEEDEKEEEKNVEEEEALTEDSIDGRGDRLDQDINSEYAVIAGDLTPVERQLMRALHHESELQQYVDALKAEATKKGIVGNREMGIYISEELERRIVFLFERVYARVDQQRPDKEFTEVENEDIMRSISAARIRLSNQIRSMSSRLKNIEYKGFFGSDVTFYTREQDKETFFLNIKKFSDEDIKKMSPEEKEEKASEYLKTVMKERMRSIPKAKEADMSDLLTGIISVVEEDLSAREYLHNVSVILRRPAGEGGFWKGLAGYAEKLRSASQDAMTRLPDADIIMDVNRELQKQLRARFADADWIHEHHMFTEAPDSNRTAIEMKVQNEIMKLYPELRDPKNLFRLQRAMSMGIGIGKGVYLNVIETAAWADPPQTISEKGASPTIMSYFYNDAAALEPLNPKHAFLRWQAEGHTKGPLIYFATEGFNKRETRHWDHLKMWKRAKNYSESYAKGQKVMMDSGEKIFIDQLDNFGHVGSLITRGGWRNVGALGGWMKTDVDGNIKPLESWKALENIGFEAVKWFGLKGGEVKGLLKKADSDHDKQAFLKYLYSKYINPEDVASTGFDDLIKQANAQAEEEFDKKYQWRKAQFPKLKQEEHEDHDEHGHDETKKKKKEKEHKHDHRAEQIRYDAGKIIVSQALAELLKQRAPSIIATVERGRLTNDGVNAYERLRRSIFLDEKAKFKKEVSGLKDDMGKTRDAKEVSDELQNESKIMMDNALSDIMLVETKLRSAKSADMKTFLRNQQTNKQKQDLSEYISPAEFNLTETVLESRMRSLYDGDPNVGKAELEVRIENAKKLFVGMKEIMDGKYMKEFASKIRDDDFPFALAIDELDTSFYTYSNSGERPLARAMGDAAAITNNAYGPMQKLLGSLHERAIDGKHDFHGIVHEIHETMHTLENVHGHALAAKVAHDMAALTISYYRLDRKAERFITKPLMIGKPKSLAGEFAGINRGAWEWDTADVDTFITELEKSGAIRRKPTDLVHGGVEIKKKNKLFGLIPRGYEVERELEYDYSGDRLRKEFGATKMDVFKTLLLNYGPLALGAFAYLAIKKAIQEANGGKGGGGHH